MRWGSWNQEVGTADHGRPLGQVMEVDHLEEEKLWRG